MKQAERFARLLVPEGKLREALELYPGKTRDEVRRILAKEVGKRLLPGGILAVLLVVFALCAGKEVSVEEGILRPAPGQPGKVIQVLLELETGWKRIPVEIGALQYTPEQAEALHREAEKYLEEVVPGNNESLEAVTEALAFPEILPSTGGEIYWSTDAPWLITSEGEVLNEALEEEQQVEIRAEISYGSESGIFSRIVTVYPAVLTEEEALLKAVREELEAKEQASRTSERFVLPESVQGYLTKQESSSGMNSKAFLFLLATAIPLFLYSGYFSGLDTKRKERKEQAERCYPEFVTKLSLLLAAGISVRQALERLAAEYEKNQGEHHVLSAELKVIRQEMNNGRSETVAYEDFGRRIGVLAYQRMASLLTQNVSRGVQGMKSLLLQEAKEVMAQERATIRQKGEQAGTKLLLPMMGLLILVFAILLVPAFQSF